MAWSGAAAFAQQAEEFTPDERRNLVGGELVRRPAQRREGNTSLIGGTSFMRVPAPRDQIWEQMLDNLNRLADGRELINVVNKKSLRQPPR